MSEKPKASNRESALISILERMVDQLRNQDRMLEDVVKRQLELAKTIENAENYRRARQIGPDAAIEKLQESFSRYRSDMLSLVNEQDHMNKNMVDLINLVNKATYSMEIANQKLAVLEERVKIQEKAVSEHYTHSIKQAEIIPQAVTDSTRSITKLHMDTEKNLGKMHHETQRQLEKLQQETTRRLLVLGDIESALKTLLVRTEPPVKKPFWIIGFLRRVGRFCRSKLSRMFGRKRSKR